jgi:alkylated DNA nucleotide flippase Atl1
MKPRKSWREKLENGQGLPQVKRIPPKMRKRCGTGTIVIPAPLEVDALVKRVPKGKVTTVSRIAEKLARVHDATIGCNVTTGIFAWIAAHAADEAEQKGEKKISPYWRVLKVGGELNPKYPGGIDNLARRLKAEGHEVFPKGKRYFVADYEQRLVKV